MAKLRPARTEEVAIYSRIDPFADSNQLAISSLLAAGFYPQHAPVSRPYKAFRWACEEGNEAVVQWLLANVGNIDISGGFHRAAKAGHVSVARLLVQRGANIEAEAGFPPTTPLMLAASKGKDEVVRELLLLGADTLPRTKHA